MADAKAMEFLAQAINDREAKKDGYAAPCRWWCLRQDLKDKYLAEARSMVEKWWNSEEETRIRQDEMHPLPTERREA
ncbi:MAG: hypothetical protein ACYTEQ_00955 [Planctomycetota bacterium]